MFLHILLVFVIPNGIFSEGNVKKWSSLKQSSDFLKIINKVLNTAKYDKFYYVDLDSKKILPLDQNYEENNERIERKVKKSENANAHVYPANGVRLLLIKNPEVLYQYQKKIEDRIRNEKYDPSTAKSKADYIQEILADLRRNAVYRLDKTSGEVNSLNEDRSFEFPRDWLSQRKQNMDHNSNVVPLIFFTEEPNKYDKTKDIDYKKSDLTKWDDSLQYPDDKNSKSKFKENDKKNLIYDDYYSPKNYKKEFNYKKMNDYHDFKRKNYDFEPENDDYKAKNNDYSDKNDVIKRENGDIKHENDDLKHKNDDFKHKNDDYKANSDDYKAKNDGYKAKNYDYKREKDDFKQKNDDYKPKEDNFKPHDDYKPYKNNDNDSYKPKMAKYKSSNNKPYKYEDDNSYRPKKIHRSGLGILGRTPIPFRGKRVIYDDKK